MSPRQKVSGRERLVDAAERLILAGGLGRVSVESVIREAGLSKGAFFHHFPSKDDLLVAIIQRLVGEMEARIAQGAPAEQESRGRRLRAQIEMSFDAPPRERERTKALLLAFMQAAFSGVSFIQAARATNEAEMRANLEGDLPVGDALLVQFALDGYWLNECLGGVPLQRRERTALRDSLLRLTRSPGRRPKEEPRP